MCITSSVGHRAAAGGLKQDPVLLPTPQAGMIRYGITTPLQLAHFVAPVSFLYTAELASGAAREGRKDLGNARSRDGRRFRGRGLIQNLQRGKAVLGL